MAQPKTPSNPAKQAPPSPSLPEPRNEPAPADFAPLHIRAYNQLRREIKGSGGFPAWNELDEFTRQQFEAAASSQSRILARLSRYQEIVEELQ